MNVSATRLRTVLGESFRMLVDRPSLFFPKIFSAVLSSTWLLAFAEGIGSPAFYIGSMPFLVFLGISVSVLVAEMVSNSSSLTRGIISLKKQVIKILGASLALIIVFTVVSLPISFGFSLYILHGAVFPLVAGLLLTFTALIVLTFLLYFLPVALLEASSAREGFRLSGRKSFSNSWEVMALTVLSFLLFGVAFLSQGAFETLGYTGFFIGRIVSSVVTTYFFVVSPNYYEATP